MNEMGKFPNQPVFPDISERFLYAFLKEGIEGAEKVIEDLAAEAAAATELAATIDALKTEDLSISVNLNFADWDKLIQSVDLIEDLTVECQRANDRLQFAQRLLENAKSNS